MSRDIKFRAWDKKRELMFGLEAPILDTEYGGIFLASDSLSHPPNSLRAADDEDLELMQYTGLKDKNGAEIFEGDVVKVWNYNSAASRLEIPEIYTVEYGRNAAFLLHNNGVWPWCGFDAIGLCKYEVIGNVWENPELLKEAA